MWNQQCLWHTNLLPIILKSQVKCFIKHTDILADQYHKLDHWKKHHNSGGPYLPQPTAYTYLIPQKSWQTQLKPDGPPPLISRAAPVCDRDTQLHGPIQFTIHQYRMIVVELEELRVGEIVWGCIIGRGEKEWYEEEVMYINLNDRIFKITYTSDSVRLYHRLYKYPVRYSA